MAKPIRGKKYVTLAGLLVVAVLSLAGWSGWDHLRFWWLFQPLGKNEQGYPEYRHRQTGIVMVELPGGVFWMGAQKEDRNGANYDPGALEGEGPVHEVTLSPFLVGKYEVTQEQWRNVTGSDPPYFERGDLPVEEITWRDCQAFCEKVELQLPSEAQWEYACRAGTTGPVSGTGILTDMGWYRANSQTSEFDWLHPVGQKSPNDFGIHDMHGNAFEYCLDTFNREFYSSGHGTQADPVCRSSSRNGATQWVIRGGYSNGYDFECRSAARASSNYSHRRFSPGFRTAFYPLP